MSNYGYINLKDIQGKAQKICDCIDWDNIPANGFCLCMVQEMLDVPRVEVK